MATPTEPTPRSYWIRHHDPRFDRPSLAMRWQLLVTEARK